LQQEGRIVGNVLIHLAIAACTSVPFNTSVASQGRELIPQNVGTL